MEELFSERGRVFRCPVQGGQKGCQKREHLRGVQKAEWESSGAMAGGKGRGEAGPRKDTPSNENSKYKGTKALSGGLAWSSGQLAHRTHIPAESGGGTGDSSRGRSGRAPSAKLRSWGCQWEEEKRSHKELILYPATSDFISLGSL